MALISTPESRTEYKNHVYQQGFDAGIQDWLYIETSATPEGRALWRHRRSGLHSDPKVYRHAYIEGYLSGCENCIYMDEWEQMNMPPFRETA